MTTHELWDADPDVCCAAFQLGACAHTEGFEQEDDDEDVTYKIVRHTFDENHPDYMRVIKTGLTLEEAQEHCNDDSTHGDGWFDGYTEE